MEYCMLGDSELRVSRLGFGGCPTGGHGWGSEAQNSKAAIQKALDAGVTFFDTADIYGLGQSETVFGEALAPARANVIIATKFGVRRIGNQTAYDNRSAYIRAALDESLQRLQTTYVDLYQLHYWDESTPLAEIQATMGDLVVAGKIRAWGVTNLDPLVLNAADGPMPVAFSYQHNLVTPHDATHLEWIRHKLAASFLSWGSLAQGALSGKYTDDHRFGADDRRAREVYSAFHGVGLAKRTALSGAMQEIKIRHPNRSLAQIAVRWILQDRPESIALVGIKRPQQIEEMVGAFGWSLTSTDMATLSSLAVRPAESFAATGTA